VLAFLPESLRVTSFSYLCSLAVELTLIHFPCFLLVYLLVLVYFLLVIFSWAFSQYIPGQYFMHRQKIEALVEFPLQSLDLSSLLKGGGNGGSTESSKYDLFAVSEHLGGLGGGHYTVNIGNECI